MKLYGYYRSSAAFRVRIALNIKGLEYEYAGVNLAAPHSEQTSASYKALNPQGRVPYLLDGNFGLGQSPAILEYLEEKYPEPSLLPGDVKDRALARQMAALIGCDIHPLNNLSVLVYLKKELAQSQDSVNAWYARWISEGFTALEALIASRAPEGLFCCGKQVSLADVYLVPQMWNARRFNVDVSHFPRLCAIDAHCRDIAAFEAAAPENQPDTPSCD